MKEEYKAGDKDIPSDEEDDEDFFLEMDLSQPGLDIEKFKKSTSGINVTPFEWSINGVQHDMNLISGFAGAHLVEEKEGEKFIKA